MERESRTRQEKQTLDWLVNPTTFQTLNLLAQIFFANRPLTAAEIIAQRRGGVYPTRTMEEISLLVKTGLIEPVLDGETDTLQKYAVTELGKMELSLQGVMPRSFVTNRLREAKESLEIEPPELPDEQYGFEEFRFTWESIFELLKRIYEHNAYRRINIALIGAPLVAFFMSRCPELVSNVSVFDINSEIVKRVNQLDSNGKIVAVRYNVVDAIPPMFSGRYDAVVIDPPWHIEHYAAFADRAWNLLRPFGRLYMSTFAPATRPEATEELSYLYKLFMEGGYRIIAIIPEFFGYAIPPFERKVFEAQGIKVQTRGNYGQLVILEKGEKRDAPCLNEELAAKLYQEEVAILNLNGTNVTLWIGRNTNPNETLRIEIFDGGRVFTTTSRSKRRRLGVNLLTPDHIAYRCSNPRKLRLIYEYWKRGVDPSSVVGKIDGMEISPDEVEVAYRFFNELIK